MRYSVFSNAAACCRRHETPHRADLAAEYAEFADWRTTKNLFSVIRVVCDRNPKEQPMSERQVLANQAKILQNQAKLLNNQKKLDQVLRNQRTIEANQRKILANQVRILAK